MTGYLTKLLDYSDEIALCFDNGNYTYKELNDRINYFFNGLKDIKSGQVVCIISDYSFEAISLFFALVKNKNIIVPIVSENREEIEKRLDVVSPDVVINLREGNFSDLPNYNVSSDSRHPLILDIVASRSSGLVLFSSGSTGVPKAMIHNLDNLLSTYADKRSKSLSIMVFLMFDHIGGLNTLLNSLAMGAKIVIPQKREPEHVAMLVEQEKINLLPASPTFLNMMLIANVHQQYDLKSLRMITYGTEAMPESLLLRLKAALPRVKLLQTFGTSETGIAQTSSRSSSSLEIRFDDPNQEYKIVDNELWLRSKTQILGYLNHDMSSFSDDGWFQTGDLVEQSGDGYLRIIGRAKEVINVGGEKVLPSEVESVLLEVDGVEDCVVYAASNAITGQTVVANITPASDMDLKELKKQIRKYCRTKLDSYKVPTKMNFSTDTGISDRFKKVRINKYSN
ncbi:long-chain fatty acid--CoA ligase [Vibrio parahaemolyticus]|uniref:ANL family adenylate-forming protein n=1 Tax=Vibrio parahaemolyticus TaxID=670 RepID=UPI0006B27620|nr:fatty acid--CoA ligase family protein [Vibrio parahaemolyticus]ELB2036762.1 long-chain fatty acid--CoA ligase [Vibrio parahaemolyticus]ELB2154852.1 long-chain fatty acid--CoA ligase [Vibrio parahaemolyticus]EME0093411.1 long-chain fatty acid--CoA ligase [Vibrio parahaemolyticus]KOY31226.1 O-succinylbenzoate--CoA ligase [Vibrio parahaemolyticus]MCC3813100.1 long-chain fatty acid--CoA ligase [Vibrio parahaemolyticus]